MLLTVVAARSRAVFVCVREFRLCGDVGAVFSLRAGFPLSRRKNDGDNAVSPCPVVSFGRWGAVGGFLASARCRSPQRNRAETFPCGRKFFRVENSTPLQNSARFQNSAAVKSSAAVKNSDVAQKKSPPKNDGQKRKAATSTGKPQSTATSNLPPQRGQSTLTPRGGQHRRKRQGEHISQEQAATGTAPTSTAQPTATNPPTLRNRGRERKQSPRRHRRTRHKRRPPRTKPTQRATPTSTLGRGLTRQPQPRGKTTTPTRTKSNSTHSRTPPQKKKTRQQRAPPAKSKTAARGTQLPAPNA